jgi:hypothetical protein
MITNQDISTLIEKYEKRIQSLERDRYFYEVESARADGAKSELEEVIEDLKYIRDIVNTELKSLES